MSIQQVQTIDKRIKEIEKEMAELIHKKSLILMKVREEKGPSFRQGGKYFQIRLRGNNYYLASSVVKFGSWLKKNGVNLANSHS